MSARTITPPPDYFTCIAGYVSEPYRLIYCSSYGSYFHSHPQGLNCVTSSISTNSPTIDDRTKELCQNPKRIFCCASYVDDDDPFTGSEPGGVESPTNPKQEESQPAPEKLPGFGRRCFYAKIKGSKRKRKPDQPAAENKPASQSPFKKKTRNMRTRVSDKQKSPVPAEPAAKSLFIPNGVIDIVAPILNQRE